MPSINDVALTAEQWNNLGESCYYGKNNEPQDYSKARQCYEKAIKLKPNFPNAFYSLGWVYEHANGVDRDYVKAVTYYQLAIQNGYQGEIQKRIDNITDSNFYYGNISGAELNNLGVIYHDGKDGITPNYDKAKLCFEKAIKQGVAAAYRNMGTLFEYGKGVPQDLPKAVTFYQLALQKGYVGDSQKKIDNIFNNASGCLLNRLAVIYHQGKDEVAVDYTTAKKLYEKAIERKACSQNCGSVLAYRNMGLLFEYAFGVNKDLITAAKYYLQAKAKGYTSPSQDIERLGLTAEHWYTLGVDYDSGSSPDRNSACMAYEQAIKVDLDHSGANAALGKFYERKNDFQTARRYFEKSNARGGRRRDLKEFEKREIEKLLKNKEGLNDRDENGRTPLHRAAKNNFLKLYAMLLYLGAEPGILDSQKNTAQSYLSVANQEKVARLQHLLSRDLKLLYRSPAEIIEASILLRGFDITLNRDSTIKILTDLYKIDAIQPLLDLAKLACLGRQRLSKRNSVIQNEYDSDNEEELTQQQMLSISIDPYKETVENLIIYEGNAYGLYHSRATPNVIYVGGNRDKPLLRGTFIHELCH